MIEEERLAKWTKDAMAALWRNYGKNEETAHLAVVLLAVLLDLEDIKRYIEERSGFNER
jgi:hypothetical protein